MSSPPLHSFDDSDILKAQSSRPTDKQCIAAVEIDDSDDEVPEYEFCEGDGWMGKMTGY